MRRSVNLLLFCVIIGKVTAPAPYNLSKTTNLSTPKSTPPQAQKLPKWNDYMTKNTNSKPMRDNAYLATLAKKSPKDNSKPILEIKKVDVTNSENKENETNNTTKVLYAEEIEPSIVIADKDSKENETAIEVQTVEDSKKENNTTEPRKGVKLIDLFKPLSTKTKVNNTEVQSKPLEIPPTMIPIFRPNPNLVRNQATKEDVVSNTPMSMFKPIQELPAQVDNSITSKEAKPNLNPNANAMTFNIPCHRASDVLDEVPAQPETARASQAKVESIPSHIRPISHEPNQVERPDKLETDESVAIIFKPKNISLLNVYGDMLKKITLTVLVPYHMSKLGQ